MDDQKAEEIPQTSQTSETRISFTNLRLLHTVTLVSNMSYVGLVLSVTSCCN